MKEYKIFQTNQKINDRSEINSKNISLEEVEIIIRNLKNEADRPICNFQYLKSECLKLTSNLPLAIFKLVVNEWVFRARPNEENVIYDNVSQISINPDEDKIKLNRFNLDGEPLFYSSAPVLSKHSNGVLTAICECCKQLLDGTATFTTKYFTVGRWIVTDVVDLVSLVFYEPAYRFNADIVELNSRYVTFINSNSDENQQLKCEAFRKFFSERAGKIHNTDNDYLLTTAFFHSCKEVYGDDIGIFYSSPVTENKGFNIALPKTAIKKRILVPYEVVMYECDRNGRHYSINPCCEIALVDDDESFKLNFQY